MLLLQNFNFRFGGYMFLVKYVKPHSQINIVVNGEAQKGMHPYPLSRSIRIIEETDRFEVGYN